MAANVTRCFGRPVGSNNRAAREVQVQQRRHKRFLMLALLPLLFGGGTELALAQSDSGAPLSTAGVSPHFDWGNTGNGGKTEAERRQTLLRGAVQVQSISVPTINQPEQPVLPINAATTAPGSGAYVGTPTKSTAHGIIQSQNAPDSSSVERLFTFTGPEQTVDPAVKAKSPFQSNLHKLTYKGKGLLNNILDYRAFGPSTEAADLILGEHKQSSSLDAKAYYKQREQDERQIKTAASIMQLAMGLGLHDTPRAKKLTADSLTSLRELVGENRTAEILACLQQQSARFTKANSLAGQEIFNLNERDEKVRRMVQAAASSDPVVKEVKDGLHKYNSHSKFVERATGVLQTALNIASFSPTIVAPVAGTSTFVLMMATGGPEQDKLLRELYFSKRLESRLKLMNDKAQLAINNYQMAVLMDNPLLFSVTQAMVRQMSGEDVMNAVLSGAAVASGTPSGDSAVNNEAGPVTSISDSDRKQKTNKNPGVL